MGGMAFFIAIMLGVTLYGVAAELCEDRSGRRRGRAPGTQRGPVPGYSIIPGEGLDSEKLSLVGPWEARCLETFHGSRTRLVLTASPLAGFDLPGHEETAAMLEGATSALCELTGADVVVVELTESPEQPSAAKGWLAMRSSDGLDWSGQVTDGRAFIVEPPDRS